MSGKEAKKLSVEDKKRKAIEKLVDSFITKEPLSLMWKQRVFKYVSKEMITQIFMTFSTENSENPVSENSDLENEGEADSAKKPSVLLAAKSGSKEVLPLPATKEENTSEEENYADKVKKEVKPNAKPQQAKMPQKRHSEIPVNVVGKSAAIYLNPNQHQGKGSGKVVPMEMARKLFSWLFSASLTTNNGGLICFSKVGNKFFAYLVKMSAIVVWYVEIQGVPTEVSFGKDDSSEACVSICCDNTMCVLKYRCGTQVQNAKFTRFSDIPPRVVSVGRTSQGKIAVGGKSIEELNSHVTDILSSREPYWRGNTENALEYWKERPSEEIQLYSRILLDVNGDCLLFYHPKNEREDPCLEIVKLEKSV